LYCSTLFTIQIPSCDESAYIPMSCLPYTWIEQILISVNIKYSCYELCCFNRELRTMSHFQETQWQLHYYTSNCHIVKKQDFQHSKWSGNFSLLVFKIMPSESALHPDCMHLLFLPSQLHGRHIKTL
jgi:hypothetical protein